MAISEQLEPVEATLGDHIRKLHCIQTDVW
jgi:hypothetical protein